MDDATWSGPHPVPLEDVDSSNRDSWAASHEDGKVAKLRQNLVKRKAEGRHPKPVVLVRTPGADKDIIADGHHHFLAAEQEGEPTVWAYVGHVTAKTGAWDTMHNQQEETTLRVPVTERDMVSKASVNYRPGERPEIRVRHLRHVQPGAVRPRA